MLVVYEYLAYVIGVLMAGRYMFVDMRADCTMIDEVDSLSVRDRMVFAWPTFGFDVCTI